MLRIYFGFGLIIIGAIVFFAAAGAYFNAFTPVSTTSSNFVDQTLSAFHDVVLGIVAMVIGLIIAGVGLVVLGVGLPGATD
jgi:hypothetical protein